ncbi:unnamed protein product, partial [Scytosiphon promiscuus]
RRQKEGGGPTHTNTRDNNTRRRRRTPAKTGETRCTLEAYGRKMDVDYADITSGEAGSFCLPLPAQAREDTLILLQTMIRNRCENFGDGRCQESKSIKVLQDYLQAHGLKSEVHARPERPERQNLICSIGSGSPRVMLGPAHVDVVPVTPDSASQSPEVYSGWEENPWSGAVAGGEVFGRGAVDMLNTVAAMAVAFVSIKESDAKLKGTLLFCAVSDEEAGGEDGAKFVLSDPGLKELFHADYCVTELGGASIPDFKLRPTLSFFQSTAEKGTTTVEVTLRGRPGHGSVPWAADSALVRAAEVVKRVHAYQTPTVITPEWKGFVKALQLPRPLGFLLTFPLLLPMALDILRKAGSAVAPVGHALTRLTMSPNGLVGAVKDNVVPGVCTVTLDCRTLPEQDEDYVLEHVRKALGSDIAGEEAHCSLRVKYHMPASRSEPDTPLWTAMEKAASAVIPGSSLVPVMLPGGTDCRYYRGIGGAVAYGANLLEPSLTFGDLTKRFHGENERIGLRSLWTSVQFYSLVSK